MKKKSYLCGTEESLQRACVRWFSLQYPYLMLHHSPNGGLLPRGALDGRRRKLMGVRAGFADLFLCAARGGYHGLFIEMKTERGRQSAAQRDFADAVRREGYRYEICRSLYGFIILIRDYLNT